MLWGKVSLRYGRYLNRDLPAAMRKNTTFIYRLEPNEIAHYRSYGGQTSVRMHTYMNDISTMSTYWGTAWYHYTCSSNQWRIQTLLKGEFWPKFVPLSSRWKTWNDKKLPFLFFKILNERGGYNPRYPLWIRNCLATRLIMKYLHVSRFENKGQQLLCLVTVHNISKVSSVPFGGVPMRKVEKYTIASHWCSSKIVYNEWEKAFITHMIL